MPILERISLKFQDVLSVFFYFEGLAGNFKGIFEVCQICHVINMIIMCFAIFAMTFKVSFWKCPMDKCLSERRIDTSDRRFQSYRKPSQAVRMVMIHPGGFWRRGSCFQTGENRSLKTHRFDV